MNKTIVHDALILCLITLIAGAALGAVHEMTAAPIKAAQEKAANETYQAILPAAEAFSESADIMAKAAEVAMPAGYGSCEAVLEAKDASGNVIGYVVNASGKGYGGQVQCSIGMDADGTVTGIGFLKISETPGLGMKATGDDFKSQFPGKKATSEFTLVKGREGDEHEIQAISGASFTSGAVTAAMNAAQYVYSNVIK